MTYHTPDDPKAATNYQGPENPRAIHYTMPSPTNGFAIASMVLGIIWLYWVGSILAVIFGHVALKQIEERNQGGRGMAIAGLVLGYIGVATLILVFLVAAGASTY